MLKRKGKPIKSSKDLESDMMKAVKAAKNKRVKIGFPAGSDTQDENGVSALYKAVVNNYGLGVPKRPFMQIAFTKNIAKYQKFLGQKISENPKDINTTLEKIGAMGKADVQRAIVDLQSPPNAQATINQKGSSNPLVDTGQMLHAVTWEVV